MRVLALLSLATALAACGSVPDPPTVNGKHRSLVNAAVPQQAEPVATVRPAAAPAQPQAPRLVAVYFDWNRTAFHPTPAQESALRDLLAGKVRSVSVRGRTDGPVSPGDEVVAIRRALAAKDWLIDNGVSPQLIVVNYVSAGDYVAGNKTSAGRALNRRVDIEVTHQ